MRWVVKNQNLPSIVSVPSIEIPAPLTRTESFLKRASDISLSVTALAVLSPVILMAVLAIRLKGISPIVVRRRQIGFDGRTFFSYKFRTRSVRGDAMMVVRTPRIEPRITALGRMLRQSGIDELPLLLNVLRGDMSLIGPRYYYIAPHGRAAVSSIAQQRNLKPGLVGWPEVNGLRGQARTIEDTERRIDLDLWYLNNWCLRLDFKIAWRLCFELKRPARTDVEFADL